MFFNFSNGDVGGGGRCIGDNLEIMVLGVMRFRMVGYGSNYGEVGGVLI